MKTIVSLIDLGTWTLRVIYDNQPQQGTHSVGVFDLSKIKVTGLEDAQLVVNQQHVFQVDCSLAGEGDLLPALYYNDLTKLPIEVKEIRGKPRVFNVQFIPIGPGQYSVDLTFSNKQIPSMCGLCNMLENSTHLVTFHYILIVLSLLCSEFRANLL